MSDRETSSIESSEQGASPPEEELRPLPDGGLTETMPEWLRRPPAWRDLARKDDGETGVRVLPEPDTSVIDPRTFVELTDLPAWLQAISSRGENPAQPEEADLPPNSQEDQAVQSEDQTSEREVPFEPVGGANSGIPNEETKVYGGGPPAGPNMMMVAAAVVVILIVIIGVIIYLM